MGPIKLHYTHEVTFPLPCVDLFSSLYCESYFGKVALKIIITLRSLAFILIRYTFGRKLSYNNSSLIAESVVDLINKVFSTNRL